VPARSTGLQAPLAGTTSQPALSSIVAAAAHNRIRHRIVAVGGVRSGAVLGGAAKGVRAVRVWPPGADRSGVSPRDSRWPAVEPSPAGDRAGSWGQIRGDRGELRRSGRVLGRLVKVTPSSKVVGDLALALVGAAYPPTNSPPTQHDSTSRIGNRLLRGELGDRPVVGRNRCAARRLPGDRPPNPPNS